MNVPSYRDRTALSRHRVWVVLAWCASLPVACAVAAADEPAVRFSTEGDRLDISIGRARVATYAFRDKEILRPYFSTVATMSGRQVTRNHPPRKDADATDHPSMHPGIWVAFGDLGGEDFWRNKGRVIHRRFVEEAKANGSRGAFVAENEYVSKDGTTLCREQCRWTVAAQAGGWWLLYDGSFTASVDGLGFGDQEEMGLGVRMATPFTAANGGEIRDSAGRKNEKAVWGQQAEWCDYGGTIDGRRIGVAVVPHAENFGRSWFHVRDYGLMVANPFGRNAFTRGETSRVDVPLDKPLRLRYATFIYDAAAGEAPDVGEIYRTLEK